MSEVKVWVEGKLELLDLEHLERFAKANDPEITDQKRREVVRDPEIQASFIVLRNKMQQKRALAELFRLSR